MNHKQETIDGYVRALLPSLVSKKELDQAFEDMGMSDDYSGVEHLIDEYVFTAYKVAEKLFERHSKTCEVCHDGGEKWPQRKEK